MVMVQGDDWIGGWGSEGSGSGEMLPPTRKVGLLICCGACQSTDIRVRSNAEGSAITWFKCAGCSTIWKEAVKYQRAVLVLGG